MALTLSRDMIRRLNRHMLPITNYLFGSTLFRHELSHPQNQNLPRLAADAAAVMSKQLPVGWEERRNNLSEHDMMLVRVPPFTHPSHDAWAPVDSRRQMRTHIHRRGRRRVNPIHAHLSHLAPTETHRVPPHRVRSRPRASSPTPTPTAPSTTKPANRWRSTG